MNTMRRNNKSLLALSALSAIMLFGNSVKASTISLQDFNFNVLINGTSFTSTISGVWGTWNSGTSTFTPVSGTWGQGYGYVATDPEILVTLNQTSALTGYQIANGSLLALAIYNYPDQSSDGTPGWANAVSSGLARAVLTDSTWTAPSWTTTGNDKDVSFTANTTAVFGSYSYNGGTEVIGLVPEPSTGALMMIGAAGLVALRRLRKV
jgi:hypothetical protein